MSDTATRNKRNRRAGQRWQTVLRDGLRDAGLDIERLALAGVEDEGDHVVRLPAGLPGRRFVVIEAKAGVLHPAQFVREAQLEAGNFAYHRGLPASTVTGIAVAKRRGANWRDAYVLTTVGDYFGLYPIGAAA
ncbi:hypothetical protein [Paractinoplanes rishiriensis]|uniref:Holliday junction resolvase n=1 Tax=Paractinoplanes rishiriensis TaxID=1050105 RepID=A0A919N1S8_9ACTN|nr:hypothetical protein [Actinoplanes rishiriensis]GIF02246.1 hypothetical protein Ari01nite_97100 [Actinoplanes rishiriensis]